VDSNGLIERRGVDLDEGMLPLQRAAAAL